MYDSQPSTPRTRVIREPHRGHYDRETAYRILDQGFICHIGFIADGQPFVIPTAYGRAGNDLYVHGSAASRMLRTLDKGVPVCITVTLLDGLVLARSVFNHSMNYRSVVVLGTATAVQEQEEKLAALQAISEHILRGRWADARKPTEQELKATLVLRIPITEFSSKIRTGPPLDDEEDISFPTWAGVVPLKMVAERAIPDERSDPNQLVPAYAREWSRG